MTRQKQVIAIDIDDVLSASAAGFAKYSNERWNADLTADDYDEDWSKFWGVPMKEALRRVEEVHESGLFGSYTAVDGALPVLHELKKRYDLIIVTSRRRSLQIETETWLDRNFPQIFSAVHHAGFYDDGLTQDVRQALKRNKAELCRTLGADYLIDDQPKHCLAAAECGVRTLLFGKYRWNRTVGHELSDYITRVNSWEAVKEYFDVQS